MREKEAHVLVELEQQLADGRGDEYRRILADDAVVIVPGAVMTKEETVAAMDESEGWDEFALQAPQVADLGPEAAAISYRFQGRRGADFVYEAVMSSVYVDRGEGWRLVLHQQTPL